MQNHKEIEIKSKDWPYDSLNAWRKTYLCLNWMVTSLSAFIITSEFGLFLLPIGVVMIAFASWIHIAVCNRKVHQITAVALLSLLYGNVMGCIILLWIRKISLNEQLE
jgi:hypothetical protein